MEIKSKWNVGDSVVTVDKATFKAVEIVVGAISAAVDRRGQTVRVHPCRADGSVEYCTSYDERFCFATVAEMAEYITAE